MRDFILKITPDERAFGFRLHEIRLCLFVVAADIDGLLVVKTRVGDEIEYSVCDAELRPVTRLGRSLDELRDEFRHR